MERSRITASTVVALAALAVAAIAIASPVLASPDRTGPSGAGPVMASDTTPPTRSIAVHGTGRVSVAPDMATVILGVAERASTAAAAQAQAASKMDSVLASVRKHGIPDSDIATVNVALSPVYDYNNGNQRLVGYEAAQSLQVKDHKLGDTGQLIDDAVAAGATQVQSISLTVSDPAAAAAQARTAAVADAKSQAQALAQAAGVSLGAPITIVASSAPAPTPIPYAGVMAAPAKDATTPIVAGTTDVVVEVDITYAIG
jgi:uncharacterized protein YggE